jgi:hypothetical protein
VDGDRDQKVTAAIRWREEVRKGKNEKKRKKEGKIENKGIM